MKEKNVIAITITILLCLAYGTLFSQSWELNYHGEYSQGRTHFNFGFVDEDGVTFLAGQQGPDYYTSVDLLLMRIEPDGGHSETTYHKDGFLIEAHHILETAGRQLFVVGRVFDQSNDAIIVLWFDKDLNLLHESIYEKEVEGTKFERCTATLDSHGNIIVATAVVQPHQPIATARRGVFLKYNQQGELINRHYLIGETDSPVYELKKFLVRQMWYRSESEQLLCLAPAYANVMSFIVFDSAFNYIEEHPIWRETDGLALDHYLNEDCYTDHWISDDEALFFSSRGDIDHNKLRVSQVTTQGEFTEFIQLNERPDTIDNVATRRCMATANDSTFYFSFRESAMKLLPGTAVVYMLNDKYDIIGRYIDDEHDIFRPCLILPTSDGGCITVNDSCDWDLEIRHSHPKITKLRREDFEIVSLSVEPSTVNEPRAFPNPCTDLLNIPLTDIYGEELRCRICDYLGRIVIDQSVPDRSGTLQLDISKLKAGAYLYQVFTPDKTILTERFIKK